MRVLVAGSGGREHALAWRLQQSPAVSSLWVAGGNAGTAQIATNLNINPEDVPAVVEAAQAHRIELVVVGPEVPLANGLVDSLASAGIPAFGPTAAAAQIEASKGFARRLMDEARVPGPDYRVFRDARAALDYVKGSEMPLVVKADGLAAGKGVALCNGSEEAMMAIQACMSDRIFGASGEVVVIEELLTGPEVSVFAFTDGESVSSLAAACDYKQAGDGGKGPNTGGMGSFSPPNFWTPALAQQVTETVMVPTIQAMAERGVPYRGVLYAGLMLTAAGPKVLEFNVRFGDPEAQVILPLLDTDPVEVMLACVEGRLAQTPVVWNDRAHVGVVMTSGGYPGPYQTGFEISGLDRDVPNTIVFHAGTGNVAGPSGPKTVTNGGRVVTVTGWGDSLADARDNAYLRVAEIEFEGAYYRSDIGEPRALEQEEKWLPNPAPPTN